MSQYKFINLQQPQNTASGVAQFILFAPVYDFEVDGIKCPEAPFASPGDKVKITSPHVFKLGRGFTKFICAPEKNHVDGKSIGDKGFNKFDFDYKFFVPGSYAQLHEAAAEMLNTPMIVLTKDSSCDDDLYYQLGCDCLFAYITLDFTTGTEKDGVKGYSGSVTYTNRSVLLYAAPGGPTILGN